MYRESDLSEGFYGSAIIASAFQILLALSMVFSWHTDIPSVLEAFIAVPLFIPFFKLLKAKNLPLTGLLARCAHTCALAVWVLIFISPVWLGWSLELATAPPYWMRPFVYR